ncbi:hypothetical protein YPPY53_3600, partial [Yersinia pestis PY-53]
MLPKVIGITARQQAN